MRGFGTWEKVGYFVFDSQWEVTAFCAGSSETSTNWGD